jgi:hypothetical protein
VVHTQGKGLLRGVMVASRPKVSLWPDGSISPGNYGWLFVLFGVFHISSLNSIQPIPRSE